MGKKTSKEQETENTISTQKPTVTKSSSVALSSGVNVGGGELSTYQKNLEKSMDKPFNSKANDPSQSYADILDIKKQPLSIVPSISLDKVVQLFFTYYDIPPPAMPRISSGKDFAWVLIMISTALGIEKTSQSLRLDETLPYLRAANSLKDVKGTIMQTFGIILQVFIYLILGIQIILTIVNIVKTIIDLVSEIVACFLNPTKVPVVVMDGIIIGASIVIAITTPLLQTLLNWYFRQRYVWVEVNTLTGEYFDTNTGKWVKYVPPKPRGWAAFVADAVEYGLKIGWEELKKITSTYFDVMKLAGNISKGVTTITDKLGSLAGASNDLLKTFGIDCQIIRDIEKALKDITGFMPAAEVSIASIGKAIGEMFSTTPPSLSPPAWFEALKRGNPQVECGPTQRQIGECIIEAKDMLENGKVFTNFTLKTGDWSDTTSMAIASSTGLSAFDKVFVFNNTSAKYCVIDELTHIPEKVKLYTQYNRTYGSDFNGDMAVTKNIKAFSSEVVDQFQSRKIMATTSGNKMFIKSISAALNSVSARYFASPIEFSGSLVIKINESDYFISIPFWCTINTLEDFKNILNYRLASSDLPMGDNDTPVVFVEIFNDMPYLVAQESIYKLEIVKNDFSDFVGITTVGNLVLDRNESVELWGKPIGTDGAEIVENYYSVWDLKSKPSSSSLAFIPFYGNSTTVVLDVAGDYVFRYTVSDSYSYDMKEVTIKYVNNSDLVEDSLIPTAQIQHNFYQGSNTVTFVAEEYPLNDFYRWELISQPAGSSINLPESVASELTFTATEYGMYTVELTAINEASSLEFTSTAHFYYYENPLLFDPVAEYPAYSEEIYLKAWSFWLNRCVATWEQRGFVNANIEEQIASIESRQLDLEASASAAYDKREKTLNCMMNAMDGTETVKYVTEKFVDMADLYQKSQDEKIEVSGYIIKEIISAGIGDYYVNVNDIEGLEIGQYIMIFNDNVDGYLMTQIVSSPICYSTPDWVEEDAYGNAILSTKVGYSLEIAHPFTEAYQIDEGKTRLVVLNPLMENV